MCWQGKMWENRTTSFSFHLCLIIKRGYESSSTVAKSTTSSSVRSQIDTQGRVLIGSPVGTNLKSVGRVQEKEEFSVQGLGLKRERRKQFLESEGKGVWRGPHDRCCGFQKNFMVRESGEEIPPNFSFPPSVLP